MSAAVARAVAASTAIINNRRRQDAFRAERDAIISLLEKKRGIP